MHSITKGKILAFSEFLREEEKSAATTEKYIRDVKAFAQWCGKEDITKELVLKYKQYLIEKYAPTSVNSVISSINCFFEFERAYGLKVKLIRIQKQIFANLDKELSKEEYERLLDVAKHQKKWRLFYLMQTICSCGIRVSELKFITVTAVKCGQAEINCKGKIRVVIMPKQLCKMLSRYIRERNIKSGSVFVSKNGKPLDRSNIWSDMKKLCKSAGVQAGKVFPHNLRHLFARTFYSLQKDVVRLADVLGHSSVNTTRIYTMEAGEIHRKQIQLLGLLRC